MPLRDAEHTLTQSIARRGPAMLDDLRSLVNFPTGPNGNGLEKARGFMSARLTALGATESRLPGDPKEAWLRAGGEPQEIPPTVICRRLRAGVPGVLLCGHLDTVHDANGPFREFQLSPDGANCTGPGCVDMKGGLVVALHTLEALEESGVPVSWGFVLNSDEETGSYHSDRAMRDEAKGYCAGLVFEPATADGGLVVKRPGSGQFVIEVRGKSGHAGRDFKTSVNAVHALAEAIVRAASLADPDRGRIVNIGPLTGGAATNIVPDFATAAGNVRYETPEIGDELGRALDSLATEGEALPRIRVRRSFNRPAKPLTPGTEALALAARTAAADLGQALPFGSTGGVCDGNNLQAAGLPTIDTLGVRGGGLHTTGEWVEVASLVERCQLAAVLIARLCGKSAD